VPSSRDAWLRVLLRGVPPRANAQVRRDPHATWRGGDRGCSDISSTSGEVERSHPGAEPDVQCPGLEQHPDKTCIGRIEKGFDSLGYHFRPDGLSVAAQTIATCLARTVRLYEHEREEPFGSPRLGKYGQPWIRWVYGGIRCRLEGGLSLNIAMPVEPKHLAADRVHGMSL
jgi:hypothetical protein